MVQNVRAYILDRQEQLQRIVSYISFQRIPGEQPGIFCAAEVCASGSLEYFLPVKLFAGIQRQNSMMPGEEGLSPHELAHKWVKDLRTRPDMSIKVG